MVICNFQFNEHFAKKIAPGSEAATILVGEVEFLSNQIVAFVRLHHAMLLPDLTEVPVPTRFFFLLLGPKGHQASYREIGRSIATMMSDEVFHEVAYKARNREDLLAGVDEFLDQVTVLPPGEWDPTIRIEPPKSVPSQQGRKTANVDAAGLPNGLMVEESGGEEHGDPTLLRTGRSVQRPDICIWRCQSHYPGKKRTTLCTVFSRESVLKLCSLLSRLFGGLVQDIRRKARWYISDFKDALHVQTLASFFFMYFACLTPIITFGGLLGSATNDNMVCLLGVQCLATSCLVIKPPTLTLTLTFWIQAAMESLVSGAICGVTYHLFSGQPLTIIGSTGPVLVFETIVYNFTTWVWPSPLLLRNKSTLMVKMSLQ